jgi:hypothetical protein
MRSSRESSERSGEEPQVSMLGDQHVVTTGHLQMSTAAVELGNGGASDLHDPHQSYP